MSLLTELRGGAQLGPDASTPGAAGDGVPRAASDRPGTRHLDRELRTADPARRLPPAARRAVRTALPVHNAASLRRDTPAPSSVSSVHPKSNMRSPAVTNLHSQASSVDPTGTGKSMHCAPETANRAPPNTFCREHNEVCGRRCGELFENTAVGGGAALRCPLFPLRGQGQADE